MVQAGQMLSSKHEYIPFVAPIEVWNASQEI